MNFIFSAVPPARTDKALWFIFKDAGLIVSKKRDGFSVPVFPGGSQPDGSNISFVNYLGTFGADHCYTGVMTSGSSLAGYHHQELRSLYDSLDKEIFDIACKAYEIANWDMTHRYCSRCGAVMEKSGIDFSKICPGCGLQSYSRISPAIIVAITRGNKILLARRPGSDLFSVVAGYVEPGETFENAVAREIREEVNIEIKNIRYFASQPWVFSHALMAAFTAEYLDGEIKTDGREIEEASWFSVNELPAALPRMQSISGKLIDWFINVSR